MRRANDNVVQLDVLDRQLMALLLQDPRQSNKSMADETGVTAETVTARLRRLLDGGVLALTALVDWTVAGYGARAYVRVRVAGRTATEAVKPLLGLAGMHVISETAGCCDVVLTVMAADAEALYETTSRIRSLDGVVGVSTNLVTETCLHNLQGTTLPIPRWSLAALPAPAVPVDDLDERLVEELITDGHESNRELARRVGVSDGTVRARLRRLEDAGLVRIAAVVDTVVAGETPSAAFVFVTLDGDDEAAVAALVADPHVGMLERTIGDADLVAVVAALDENELYTYVSRTLRQVSGVSRVEVATAIEALRHDAHLVRFV
jgi:DNA-binding Lrp family transcriptional regulator